MAEPLAARRALEKRVLPKCSILSGIPQYRAQAIKTSRQTAAAHIGYYEKGKLLYAGRTRNSFRSAVRVKLAKRLRPLQIDGCPFDNLPEKKSGRRGQGLTAAKTKECCWLKPVLVGQFEFVEWTADRHLRHTRFHFPER